MLSARLIQLMLRTVVSDEADVLGDDNDDDKQLHTAVKTVFSLPESGEGKL